MKRIQLGNTVFEGENNAYLIDGGVTALVDTGVATPDTRTELEAGLADHDVGFTDVDAVFLTHWHPDHAGLAGEIQAAGDAEVFIHEADASLVDGSERHFAEDDETQTAVFDRWGMPDESRERLREFFSTVGTGLRGRDATVTPFTDGETFDLGAITLTAVHLPGHTAGLSGFAFDPRELSANETGGDASDRTEHGVGDEDPVEAFTGDALLPQYTPNVGGADVRVTNPLETYADSLARIVALDWGAAHPGHRERIDEPGHRAAEILAHHRHRTRRVLDVLAAGPATVWEVSAALFGDLEAIHVLHGPGEASAHLDHLAAAGVVERDGIDYRLVDPDPAVDELFPATVLDGDVDADTEEGDSSETTHES